MQTEIIIDKVMSAGLSVLEHENNGDFGNGVMHLTIVVVFAALNSIQQPELCTLTP